MGTNTRKNILIDRDG